MFYTHMYTHVLICISSMFPFTSCIQNVFALLVGVYNLYLLRLPKKKVLFADSIF